MTTFQNISYVFARSGQQLIISVFNTSYASLFLTVVAGLSMAATASALALAKFLNLLTVLFLQPVLLSVAEKLKWGRYRSMFLLCPIISFIGHLLMQSSLVLAIPDGAKVTVVIIGYLLLNISMDLHQTVLNALNQTMVPVNKRFMMQSLMNVVNNVVGTVLGFAMLPIIYHVGKVEQINGPGMTVIVIIYNVINIIVSIALFKATENVNMDGGSKPEKIQLLSVIKLIFTNRNVAGVFWGQSLSNAGNFAWLSVFSFVFLYYYKDSAMLSAYNGWSKAIAIVASLVTVALASKLRPKVANIISYIGAAASYLFIFFFAKNPLVAMIFVLIASMFHALNWSPTMPMYSEASEYTRWKTGENVTAVVFSVQQVNFKLASYISAISVSALAWIGFSATDELTHTPEILGNMKAIATLIPAGFYVLALICYLILHNITPAKMEIARKELAEREPVE